MNIQEFIENAKRTESVPETININVAVFEQLQSALIDISDCFDLIKKKVFYGKDIDVDRFKARLTVASHTLSELKTRCQENPNFINTGSIVKINPRELHAALGILTESSEIFELVNLHREKMNPLNAIDELGDLFWYIAILVDQKEIDIEQQVLTGVIAKLRKRFPDKFEAALAITKDKSVELAETAMVTGISDIPSPISSEPVVEPVVEPVKKKGGRPRMTDEEKRIAAEKRAKKKKSTKKRKTRKK